MACCPVGTWGLQTWLLLLLVVNLLIVRAFNDHGACANDCTGHGRCSQENACICDSKWSVVADCSQTTCPSGISWVGKAMRPGFAHGMAECSNRGLCDRTSGACQCFDGYEGPACERLACPNNCGEHGTCMTIGNIYKLYSSEVPLSTVYLSNSSLFYSRWDAEKLTQCICDYGYTGNACELRMCPKGDDPMTSFANYLTVTISLRVSAGKLGGNVYLLINGQLIVFPAWYGSWSTSLCEKQFGAMNNIEEVSCRRTQNPDSKGNVDWVVAFRKFPMIPYENNIYTNNGSLPLSNFICRTTYMTGTGASCKITNMTANSLPGKSTQIGGKKTLFRGKSSSASPLFNPHTKQSTLIAATGAFVTLASASAAATKTSPTRTATRTCTACDPSRQCRRRTF